MWYLVIHHDQVQTLCPDNRSESMPFLSRAAFGNQEQST